MTVLYRTNLVLEQKADFNEQWTFAYETQKNPIATTIASGSNGQALPQSTIFVVDPTNSLNPTGGTVAIVIGSSVVDVVYTSAANGTLSGCTTTGTGTLFTGQSVSTYLYTYFNFTGYTAQMDIRLQNTRQSPSLLSLTSGGGGLSFVSAIIPGGPQLPTYPNTAAITITNAQSEALPSGSLNYDNIITSGTGVNSVALKGNVLNESTVAGT